MKRAYVQLGRFGDVINILPLVFEYSRMSATAPRVVIGKEFASILDGVSYAVPDVWNGAWEDVAGAVKHAEAFYDEILVTQVHGNYHARNICDTYCRDMWAQVGRLDWGSLPLTFDLRDSAREAALMQSVGGVGAQTILVAIDGESSPYDKGPELLKRLKQRFGEKRVLHLNFKAHRLYDLLGLFDAAGCLVSIDTAHMHLAHASTVPVIALTSTSHHGWGATSRYPGQVFRCPYSEVGKREGEMYAAIESAIEVGRASRRKLVHAWNDRTGRDPGATKRHNIAKRTWEREYASGHWTQAAVMTSNLVKTSKEIGDPRPVPTINEIVDQAILRAKDGDLIVLTNEDISFAPGITDTLMAYRGQCAWAHRYDFKSINQAVTTLGLANGHKYPGIDLFVFTPKWWREQEFPTFYIGRQRWDLCVKVAMQISEGQELAVACAHEQHPSFWSTGNAENTNPANRWNWQMSERWILKRGVEVVA